MSSIKKGIILLMLPHWTRCINVSFNTCSVIKPALKIDTNQHWKLNDDKLEQLLCFLFTFLRWPMFVGVQVLEMVQVLVHLSCWLIYPKPLKVCSIKSATDFVVSGKAPDIFSRETFGIFFSCLDPEKCIKDIITTCNIVDQHDGC